MVLRSHHSTNYSERRTIWQGSCVSEAGSLTPDRCCSLFIGCLSGSASCTRRHSWHSRRGSHRLRHTWQICYNFDHRQDRCGPPTLHCWLYHEHKLHWRHALSLWLRPLSGTVYRPTSGRATRCLLSDAIWKLTILPPRMRNVATPAPLYLQSSRRSTNSIIIYRSENGNGIYGESNIHVIDDVTWPWKVEVVTPICLGHFI